MIPNAKVSVVGLARNHETLQPENYFERFVGHLDERTALIIDPMLATAGSMIATVDLLKARGCTRRARAGAGRRAGGRRGAGRGASRRALLDGGDRQPPERASATSSRAWATRATRSSAPSEAGPARPAKARVGVTPGSRDPSCGAVHTVPARPMGPQHACASGDPADCHAELRLAITRRSASGDRRVRRRHGRARSARDSRRRSDARGDAREPLRRPQTALRIEAVCACAAVGGVRSGSADGGADRAARCWCWCSNRRAAARRW